MSALLAAVCVLVLMLPPHGGWWWIGDGFCLGALLFAIVADFFITGEALRDR